MRPHDAKGRQYFQEIAGNRCCIPSPAAAANHQQLSAKQQQQSCAKLHRGKHNLPRIKPRIKIINAGDATLLHLIAINVLMYY